MPCRSRLRALALGPRARARRVMCVASGSSRSMKSTSNPYKISRLHLGANSQRANSELRKSQDCFEKGMYVDLVKSGARAKMAERDVLRSILFSYAPEFFFGRLELDNWDTESGYFDRFPSEFIDRSLHTVGRIHR